MLGALLNPLPQGNQLWVALKNLSVTIKQRNLYSEASS